MLFVLVFFSIFPFVSFSFFLSSLLVLPFLPFLPLFPSSSSCSSCSCFSSSVHISASFPLPWLSPGSFISARACSWSQRISQPLLQQMKRYIWKKEEEMEGRGCEEERRWQRTRGEKRTRSRRRRLPMMFLLVRCFKRREQVVCLWFLFLPRLLWSTHQQEHGILWMNMYVCMRMNQNESKWIGYLTSSKSKSKSWTKQGTTNEVTKIEMKLLQ